MLRQQRQERRDGELRQQRAAIESEREARAAMALQRWFRHARANERLRLQLMRAGAQRRKSGKLGRFLGVSKGYQLRIGSDYLEYTKARGSKPKRLALAEVAVVEPVPKDAVAWRLVMRDGAKYVFRAENADARTAWVDGVKHQMSQLALGKWSRTLATANRELARTPR